MTVNLTTATHNFSANWPTHGDVHKALNGWHNGGVADSGLEHLYLFQHARLTGADTVRAAHNRVLQQALEQLTQSNAEYAQILQLRFLDNLKVRKCGQSVKFGLIDFL
ncbi:MAG: hypothetical protein R2932_57145 [Caldilineaceae bacterium]